MNGFDPIWNNVPRACLFMVFYLMFSFCYLVYQSSVLGPLVFTMYAHPLGIIVQRRGIKYHLHADDTQQYISLDPDNEINLLQVPVSQLKSYGDCTFSVAAPTLWNKLPTDNRNVSSLENFKSILKTLLFKVAFTDK